MGIRHAVARVRKGNLTEAARECNLVLPAASRRIRDLEKALAATVRASLAWRCADGAGACLHETGQGDSWRWPSAPMRARRQSL